MNQFLAQTGAGVGTATFGMLPVQSEACLAQPQSEQGAKQGFFTGAPPEKYSLLLLNNREKQGFL